MKKRNQKELEKPTQENEVSIGFSRSTKDSLLLENKKEGSKR